LQQHRSKLVDSENKKRQVDAQVINVEEAMMINIMLVDGFLAIMKDPEELKAAHAMLQRWERESNMLALGDGMEHEAENPDVIDVEYNEDEDDES
jgi:hypothetical protein